MLKNFFCGVAVGVANIIPGVSGGTIIVLLGLFDELMAAISNVFKINISWKERFKSIKFIVQVGLGVVVGLVGFAKILEFLFVHAEIQTIMWFVGLILFSIPVLKKNEMKGEKISWLYFIVGVLIIGLLAFFVPSKDEVIVPLQDILANKLNITYIITLIILGAISGATMIFPGVSGSMVLLVLGYYHLFKGYVANVTSFEPKIIIGLIFIAIGVLLGIVLSAKLTNWLLKKYHPQTMSLIVGLIVMSAVTIIPLSGYNLITIITSILTFLFGGSIVILVDKLKKD
ncbi:MAG: DUF368 domain-containing protein [Firmicutes bacterium]|nr:DUF368 domain-containing protein [Bacillota bacterium]